MTLTPAAALGGLPGGLRQELLNEYSKITRNFRERRWEAAELDGGRLCEIVYTILDGHLRGNQFVAHASKPAKFDDACKKLEQTQRLRDPTLRASLSLGYWSGFTICGTAEESAMWVAM